MREFTAGAIAGLLAYAAAWWSVQGPAAQGSAGAEALLKPRRAAAVTSVRAEQAEPPESEGSASASKPAAHQRRAAETAAAPVSSADQGEMSLPPEALPAPLRRLAEFRRDGEKPEELVKRVESFELSPEELERFRRVANQLFELPPNGMERQASPWAAGGRRSGELKEPR